MISRFLRLATLALFAAAATNAGAAPCPTTTIDPATALPGATVGVSYNQPFTATGSGTPPFAFAIVSGLPSPSGLNFKASGANSATLMGSPAQAGNYLVTVAATDTNGCSGGRTYALAIAQGSQTIAFTSTAPASAQIGGPAYGVAANATSGLPVTFAIDAGSSAVCAIAGASVTFQSAGLCTINANQAGNVNWTAAPQAQQSFAVGAADQTIAFTSTAPAAAVVAGAAYTVAATATSGLPVTYAIDASASSVCSIAGSSVTFQNAGTCTINANQAGNASWNAAPQAQQSFAVGAGAQTISYTSTAPAAATVDGATYTVTATAISGLPVAFTIDASAAGVCTIAGSTVSFVGAGTCVVNANQAGNANWNAAPQVQQSFAVARGSQTISYTSTAPVGAVVAGAAYTVTATAMSGLPVAFTIDAGAAGVCTIAGSTVSFIGAGTCVVNANQAGNANWNAAPQVQQSFAVGRGNQTISFIWTAPAAMVGGPSATPTATATSGLPVTFTIDASASAVCSIAGSSVTFQGAGTCRINANQAGDANWNAAMQSQTSFPVGRGNQAITYTSTAPTGARFAGPAYTVAAAATSGLAVTFTINAVSSGVCSIAGSTVSFIGVGTCIVDANQAGDANWNAAPQAQQTFAVARGSQTLQLVGNFPTATVGGPTYTAVATATSGLPVAITIDASAAGVCTVAGVTVSFIGVGTCVINANQAGNANWNPALPEQIGFPVGRGNQTITYTSTAPAAATFGGATYTVTATATSGLPVAFTIAAPSASVCTIAGSTVSFIGVGTCIVNANQAGNANWNAAPQVQQSFAVAKASQTIAFTSTAPAAATFGGATYAVTATATSGLPVTFTIDASASAVCSIAGSTVSFIGAGTCVVNANQAGNANWNAAPQIQQSFAVAKAEQTITFTSTAPANPTIGSTYGAAATAASGLPVTLTIDAASSAVCSIAGATVTFNTAGTCVVNADQAGNANWNAAPQAQQSMVVSACVVLAVGEVANRDMPGGADICIVNNDAAAAEYTYIPLNFSTSAEATMGVVANNIQGVTGPPVPRPGNGGGLAPLADAAATPAGADPHTFEAPPAFDRPYDLSDLVPVRGGGAPLVVGQLIDLNASVGSCGATQSIRKARVEAVSTQQSANQQVLYAVQEVVETTAGAGDWHPPVVGGYQTIDFQNFVNAFTVPASSVVGMQLTPNGSIDATSTPPLLFTGAADIATNNFGAMTDLDVNGGVIAFFTPAMNALSPPATAGPALGLFQPRDLFAAAPCGGSNEAEILYLPVPDPTGSVNSNVRTVSGAYAQVMPALVHHYTHLTNAVRRLYHNGGAPFEEPWLDEAIAYQMQELVFFNVSAGLAPRSNVNLAALTSGPAASVRVRAFNMYQNPMFGALREYFYRLAGSPNGSRRAGPLRQAAYSPNSTPTRHEVIVQGHAVTFSFLRYALDRKNTGDAALLTALVNSNNTGIANLQAVLNVPVEDWVRDFIVAAYADDAVTGVAPEYTTPSWNFRLVYSGLGGFPLVTSPLTNATPLAFPLGPGGGSSFQRFGVAAGQTATVTLTQGGGTPTAQIRTAILRTK